MKSSSSTRRGRFDTLPGALDNGYLGLHDVCREEARDLGLEDGQQAVGAVFVCQAHAARVDAREISSIAVQVPGHVSAYGQSV